MEQTRRIRVECFDRELSRNPSLLDVNAEADRIRTECPIFGPTNAEVLEHPVLPISTEDREQYNDELRRFYEEHDTFVDAHNSWRQAESHTIRFDLWLYNQGTEPADDVDQSSTHLG